jgi:hypothetical protein
MLHVLASSANNADRLQRGMKALKAGRRSLTDNEKTNNREGVSDESDQ